MDRSSKSWRESKRKSKGHKSYSSGDDRGKDEVIQVEMNGKDENWGENTTCVTGNTSEHSYNCDDVRSGLLREYQNSDSDRQKRCIRMRCARVMWLIIAGFLSLAAYLSPVAMVILPKTVTPIFKDFNWTTSECLPDCEGLLISFSFKQLILLLGVLALFFRHSLYDLPRLFLARACLLSLLFLLTFAYWLFYGVRIVQRRESNYTAIVVFSLSLVDALLFVHYLAVILLEIRHLRPEYKISVVRSPDGEWKTYSVGAFSIQRASVLVLQNYYKDFPVFNPFLNKLPGGSSRMRIRGGSQVGSTAPSAGFKMYSIDGNGPEHISDVNAQALMIAAARKRDAGHNERFYEELDWDRRVKKRKARLLTATEEAFNHVKRLQHEKGPCIPMEPHEAAQAIFPSLARSLQKYLRVTRQQPRHTAEQVVRHLAQYLSFDMSPRSFMQRFFSSQPTLETYQSQMKWSLVCDQLVSQPLNHNTIFQLRCHCAGPDAGVQLLCTVTRTPFFNITEQPFDSKNNKFVLKLNSETSV